MGCSSLDVAAVSFCQLFGLSCSSCSTPLMTLQPMKPLPRAFFLNPFRAISFHGRLETVEKLFLFSMLLLVDFMN